MAILSLLFWWVGPAAILKQYAYIAWQPLVGVALTLVVQFWMYLKRWQLIAETLAGQPLPAGHLARALGAGFLYGQFLPASVGGDLVRVAAVGRRAGVRVAMLSVVADRLSGLAVLCAIIAVLAPFIAVRLEAPTVVVAGIAVAVVIGLPAMLLLIRFRPAPIRSLLARLPYVEDLGRSVFGQTVALPVFVLGLGVNLTPVVLFYLLARSIGVELAIVDCLLVVPPAMLLTALPISLAGWGVREGAMAGGFALLGVAPASVVPVSVLFGLTGPLIGLAYALTMPFLGGDDAEELGRKS